MAKPFRRYEMLLPLRFNDGKSVPAELIADTLLELLKVRFRQIDIWLTTYPLDVI